jgi:hemolysin III
LSINPESPGNEQNLRTQRPPVSLNFPNYSVAEKVVDAAIHVTGLLGASIAVSIMFARLGQGVASQSVALIVYGLGLLGMLIASGLYNLTPNRAGRLKAALRHLDHAMIFVMIAGSYTPFAVSALRPALGVPLCLAIWILAAVGVGLRLGWGRIYERISIMLYLGMGWLVLVVLPSLARAVSGQVLVLLLLGGTIYSLGSLIHARIHMPFQNPVWHLMVVVAAALHLAAVAQLPS